MRDHIGQRLQPHLLTASLNLVMKHDSLINMLRGGFAAAVAKVAGVQPGQLDPQVRPAQEARFGDYQCNVAMSLAKSLKAKPREIAQRIVAELNVSDLCEPPEIAGPGFINVRLTNQALSQYLGEIPAPPETEPRAQATGAVGERPEAPRLRSGFGLDRLGMPPVEKPRKVVIDYSSPNIAKQMHVGHLRSTIIGDVFARVLGFEGHEIIRQNHVGDWGTQFGILIELYKQRPVPTTETHDDVLEAIEHDYRDAQQRFETDAVFADAARQSVGALQSGDLEARRVWERICAQSRHAFTDAYGRLNVLLQDQDVRGESFYNDRLGPVIQELTEELEPRGAHGQAAPAHGTRREGEAPAEPRAELREDGGAQCIFLYDQQGQPRFRKPDGDELPMIIQKSDGAYLYATTDLAAIRYRIKELGATRLIYVTDARQKLHFQMLFAATRAIGWAGDDVQLEHATFGSVLGANRRPLKTREGENVRLRELLDEAERRAYELLETRERDEATKRRSDEAEEGTAASFTEEQKNEIARRVGIGAVKYADLARDRNSDYVFNWDQMLALQGNTAPYMMYAYARIRSIYRKAAERFGSPDVYGPGVALTLSEPAERALALRLARLRETIDAVAAELAPHILCGYLYELAAEFMRFYEACPVIQAPDEATRLSRMRLCDLTARVLRLGLGLLGIEAVERM
jgi:arginyl-tRNA synthetase